MKLGCPVLILWANVPVCSWKMPPLWGHVAVQRVVRHLGTISPLSLMARLHGDKLKSFGLIIQKASLGQ